MAAAGRQIEECELSVTCPICLDLLDEPKVLSCEHTFCLECLQGYQRGIGSKACPVCKQKTVPPKTEISNLLTNQFASQLVQLIRKHKNEPEPPKVDGETKEKKWGTLPDEPDVDEQLGELLLRAFAHGIRHNNIPERLRRAERPTRYDANGRPIHDGITCDYCQKHDIVGWRYKCGVCDDYDLCQECFPKFSDIPNHDKSHLFIVIQKPCHVGFGANLNVEEALMLGTSLDSNSQKHRTVSCNGCQIKPVVGYRYKCGLCANYDLCEECVKNVSLHHSETHTFIVIPYEAHYHPITNPMQTRNFYT